MKTKLLSIIMLLCFAVQGFAQNNDMKARMEFEDAETAYQNQDYSKAVTHLESAEKLLGKPTGKTRYLLILALKRRLPVDYEYKDLEKLRSLTKHYIDNYTTDTEKYRDIYDLSNNLNKNFPKNLAEYNQIKQKEAEEFRLVQEKKQQKEKQEAEELKQAQAYVLNFAKKYNYRPNITTSEFTALSSENEKLVKKLKKIKDSDKLYAGDPWSGKLGPISISVYNDKVFNFLYLVMYDVRNHQSVDNKVNEIYHDIQKNISSKYYTYLERKDDISIFIRVPGIELKTVQIYINKSDKGNKYKIRVDFYQYSE